MTADAQRSRRRIALIVPGGVDRSGERRIIPALIALLARLTRRYDVQVFALLQERQPAEWDLVGARIHNIGARATRLRAIAAIVQQHRLARFDAIHSIFSGACGLIAIMAAAAIRVPSIVHVAGGELAALPRISYGGRLNRRGRIREALILRSASHVTAASSPIIDALRQLGVAAERVPLGVDFETWPPRPPQRRDVRTRARLLHVASINRVKDQATLLHAIARLKARGTRLHLDIVGEDTLNGEIHALAHDLQLNDCVRFHGFLIQPEWRPLAERAHVLVMTSQHEAGPLAVLEAAAIGVPTVGTAVGHIAEWSPHAALATPVGDAAQLAANLGRVLDDEALRFQLAAAAYERALEYDADTTARSFSGIYERLCGARPAASRILTPP